MRVSPVLCFFLFLFMVLMYSAYGTTLTSEARSQNQPKVMYGGINRWNSKVENQRRQPALHVVQHGASGGGRGANSAHPHNNGHKNNDASSLSIKHTSLFMAVFRHPIFGLLLVICFY